MGWVSDARTWGTLAHEFRQFQYYVFFLGAKTVSLGWAYFLGSIMEIVGCTLLSGDVIKKVVNGIVNIDVYRYIFFFKR